MPALRPRGYLEKPEHNFSFIISQHPALYLPHFLILFPRGSLGYFFFFCSFPLINIQFSVGAADLSYPPRFRNPPPIRRKKKINTARKINPIEILNQVRNNKLNRADCVPVSGLIISRNWFATCVQCLAKPHVCLQQMLMM